MSLIDVLVALVFLLALIAVSRFRKYLTEKDKQSYYHVVGGLAIMAVVSLAQIYSRMGALEAVPFVSDPLFFRLVFCIGIITGLVLLVDGVSNWAPLSRSYRNYNKERVKRLELLQKLQKLARVENRIAVVLEHTLAHMLESHDLSRGAVWVYARNTESLNLVSSSGFEAFDVDPSGISFDIDKFRVLTAVTGPDKENLVLQMPDSISRPTMVLPIVAGALPAGLVLLWKKKNVALPDEDRMNLKLAVDIVGQKLYSDLLQLKNDYQNEVRQWTLRLRTAIDFHADPKDCLTTIAEYLKKKMPLDFFSLTIVHHDRSAQRYTIGPNGGILRERGLDFDATESVTNLVFADEQSIVVDDLSSAADITLDDIVARSALRSLAVIPVDPGSGAIGVLTVGSLMPRQLGARRRLLLEAIAPILSYLASKERHRYEQNITARRSFLVNNFVSEISDVPTWQEAFTKAAQIISRELKATVVRISTVDSRGAFLNSQALETARVIAGIAPVKGSMILSLMPYHQLVIDTCRPMMVNQESTDRKMTDLESKQVFGVELKSSLLVPVKIKDTVVAVVSLAEVRNWQRFQFRQSDIQFVSAIAGVLSMAVQLGRKDRASATPRVKETSAKSERADAVARNRIRSSLTGILGSVEILRTSKQPTDENLEKCLAIIDRSARRINDCIPTE